MRRSPIRARRPRRARMRSRPETRRDGYEVTARGTTTRGDRLWTKAPAPASLTGWPGRSSPSPPRIRCGSPSTGLQPPAKPRWPTSSRCSFAPGAAKSSAPRPKASTCPGTALPARRILTRNELSRLLRLRRAPPGPARSAGPGRRPAVPARGLRRRHRHRCVPAGHDGPCRGGAAP